MSLSRYMLFFCSAPKPARGFLNKSRLRQFRSSSVCSSLQHGTAAGQDHTRSSALKRGSLPHARAQITRGGKHQLKCPIPKIIHRKTLVVLNHCFSSFSFFLSLSLPQEFCGDPAPLVAREAHGELHRAHSSPAQQLSGECGNSCN